MLANKKIDNLFFFSWLVSIIATFGSLYFSEIKNLFLVNYVGISGFSCIHWRFCYVLLMYEKNWKMSLYAMILSGIGGCISLYHYSIQKIAYLGETCHFVCRASMYSTIHKLVWVYHHSIFSINRIYSYI